MLNARAAMAATAENTYLIYKIAFFHYLKSKDNGILPEVKNA